MGVLVVRRPRLVAPAALSLLVVVVATVGGCATSGPDAAPPSSTATTAPAETVGTAAPSSPAPATSASPSTSADELPPVGDPVSLAALMREEIVGSGLRLGRVLDRTSAYTRHAVTYRSGDLRISGVMNVPRGAGPFPVVVLLHGYIDPAVYVTGQGYRREQDSLARNGYVAFHVDYRNHAGSDDDPSNDLDLRMGYTRDAVAAVEAVRTSSLPFLDGDRIAMIGRSMGGGVAFNALAVRPGLVDAAITYASVSTDAVDNYEQFVKREDDDRALVRRIEAAHGSPQEDPEFWRGVSVRNHLDRITTPVMVHHGIADETCPIAWSRATVAALRAADVDVTYHEYRGEGHYFYGAWAQSMRRTLAFLGEQLRA